MIKVAIIDDEQEVLTYYKNVLKSNDYVVLFTASNGFDAIDKINNSIEKPDIILMDYSMPEKDGIETTIEILKDNPDIKIIFVTAYDNVKKAAIDAGASRVLTKPVQRNILLKNIGEVLQHNFNTYKDKKKDNFCKNIMYDGEYIKIIPIFKERPLKSNDNFCFIIMPFSNEHKLQDVYECSIKPTIEKLDINCRRADDIYHNKGIVNVIWENIISSNFIIAELTGKNPNVLYELGIAHTVGKEVILLSQKLEDVPFDLRHLKIIIYENDLKGVKKLEEELDKTIINLIENGLIKSLDN